MIAILAYVLHTPVTAFLAMPWDEIVAWSIEAETIIASRDIRPAI